MSTVCPQCNSPNTSGSQIVQKTGASIGIIVGAIYGYRIGAIFGPVGMFTGPIAGLIYGAISGCEVGYLLGKTIDDRIINSYVCQSCLFPFNI